MAATVAELITRVEKRLALASGMDVQIHAEDKLLEMLRHMYNVLFDDHWWLDALSMTSYTLDETAGLVTEDVSDKIKRFVDINSVFYEGLARPLPTLPIRTNPTLFTGNAIAPYAADKTKVFKVYPVTLSGSVHVWHRTRMEADDWDLAKAETTTVNIDDEMLILGVVFDFLADDGSNPDAAKKYQSEFATRRQQLLDLELQHGIAKNGSAGGYPTQWLLMNG